MNNDKFRKQSSPSQEDQSLKRKLYDAELDEYDSEDEEIPEETKLFMQFLVKHCLSSSLSGGTLKNNSFSLILNTPKQCEHFIKILNDYCRLPKVINIEEANNYHYYDERSSPPEIYIGKISLQNLIEAIRNNRNEMGVNFLAERLGNEGHKVVNLQDKLEEIFPREQNINIQRAIPQLEDQFVVLAAQVTDLKEKNVQLTTQVNELTEKNIQLTDQLQEVKEQFSAQVDKLTNEKNDMEARLKRLEDLLLKQQNVDSDPSNSSNTPNTGASIFSRQRN